MDGLFFEDEAANVYRTKNYIVEQVLCLKDDNVHTAQMCSHDTFIRRTKKRDEKKKKLFASRKHIDGKRMPTNMCIKGKEAPCERGFFM